MSGRKKYKKKTQAINFREISGIVVRSKCDEQKSLRATDRQSNKNSINTLFIGVIYRSHLSSGQEETKHPLCGTL